MKNYHVYFKIGDKNLKMRVQAHSQLDAIDKLRENLKVVRVLEEPSPKDDAFNKLSDLLNDLEQAPWKP